MKDYFAQSMYLQSKHSNGGRPTENYSSMDFRTMNENDQSGAGFADAFNFVERANQAKQAVQNAASGAMNLYSKGLQASNVLPNMAPNGTKMYPGEMHALLKSNRNIPITANWCGPGTQVAKRIARGDLYRNNVDKACASHDLSYTLATDLSELEAADQKMLNSIDRIEKEGSDNKWNINIARQPIRAKTWLEKYKLLNPSQFSGDIEQSYNQRGYTADDIERMKKRQAELQQEGYGRRLAPKKFYPTDKLKMNTIKQIAKARKKEKRKELKQLLQSARKPSELLALMPNLAQLKFK